MVRPHIIVGDDAIRNSEFKARSGGRSEWLSREREVQASRVSCMYENALRLAKERRDALDIDNRYKASGNYIEMEVNRNCIKLDSLDTRGGARLMNIKSGNADINTITATLFLPDGNEGWLETKLAKYRNPEKDRVGKRGTTPANGRLINSIEKIDESSVLDFLTNPEDAAKYERYPDDYMVCCEMWISGDVGDFKDGKVFERLDALQIEHSSRYCAFEGVAVVLVKSAKAVLNNLVSSINNLSEIRLFKEASVLLSQGLTEQWNWMKLIEDCTVFQEAKARVAIIDSGVNNRHPLLVRSLPDGRCHNATSAGMSDRCGHGTLLAGLALYGDLTEVIYSKGNICVNTDLSSVKILPGEDEMPNDEELYGVIMEDAISQAREDKAYIQCSAVTAREENTASEPSSWSSAIDKTLFNEGTADTVLFVSAGNVRETGGEPYPDFNIHNEIRDPAQSWNAVTVGAYTEKVVIGDPKYAGIIPIAPKGGLSPYSSTSMMWDNGLVKPEILMEGGNAIDEKGIVSPAPDDLNLVSTCAPFAVGKYFGAVQATSAATALAARLAAKIKCENPNLSALSIRALMVHSAEWTEAMKNMFKDDKGEVNTLALLHTCGYGAPVEEKALASSDCYATFISEQTLTPLVKDARNKYKMSSFHLYTLPWPKDVLEQVGAEEVKLRITLSYYIQPAPGSRTRQNKYRYPSLGLRFDVIQPTESEAQFISRVSHIENEGIEKTRSGKRRWSIGTQKRNQGSVISDYMVSSAAEIASCNKIAVFPATGWWKDRKYTGDKSIKYSLVVSIETETTEIYNSIAQQITVEV